MEVPAFFGNDAADLGHCRRLSQKTFHDFVDQVLNMAVVLNVTREQYIAMDSAERQKAKRVPYVVPCTFAESPSRRLHELAQRVSLVCLDIDDSVFAAPYVHSPEVLAEQLMPFAFAVHTTASSTPSAPRVRILVAASLPVARYRDAVQDVARRIGLPRVNKESGVAVQPMYLPTLFKGEEDTHPLVWAERDGRLYSEQDIIFQPNMADVGVNGAVGPQEQFDASTGDELDYLRPTLEGINVTDVAAALQHLDPDMSYPEWLEIAACIRHQFPREPDSVTAYTLFDEWSSRGAKYAGADDTQAKWNSLRPSPRGRVPLTVRTLFRRASEAGWDASPVKARCFADVRTWLRNKNVPSERYIVEGLRRIAGTPLLSQSEEEALLHELVRTAKTGEDGMQVSIAVIRKDLRRMKAAQSIDKKKKDAPPPWAKGICYVSRLDEFFRPATIEHFSPEALNRSYGNRLLPSEEQLKEMGDDSISTKARPVVQPQDYLLNIIKVPIVYDTLYDPRQPNDVFISQGGKTYVNTYVRSHPEPDRARAAVAGAALEAHLVKLISEPEYRVLLLDFLTYLVQQPGRKIRWAMLIQGAEGGGKTLLAEVMKMVLGKEHVISIDNDALNRGWNEWAGNAQLVAFEEIRVAGQNRHEIMNRLKPLITNDHICVNQRLRDSRTIENKTNYILFTNHHDALALTAGDRRYFIIKSIIQTKRQVEALGDDYFDKLFKILREETAGLRAWFEDRRISDGFKPDGHAPQTIYFQQIVSDTTNDTTSAVREILEDSLHPLVRADLLSSSVLVQMLETRGLTKISGQHLAAVLRDEGYISAGRWALRDGAKHAMWLHAGNGLSVQDVTKLADSRLKESNSEPGDKPEDLL